MAGTRTRGSGDTAERAIRGGRLRESPARSAPTVDIESELWGRGAEIVVGVDEVGRGAWAGPVCVGMAVLDRDALVTGVPEAIADSKTMSEERRESAYAVVTTCCSAWSVGGATSIECDELGMSAAQRLAAHRALAQLLEQLGRSPDRLLIDGTHDFVRAVGPCGAIAATMIVKGDRSCASIAAASVLAKVTRDRYMRGLDLHFPAFDFASNKGYPSPVHRQALAGFGPTSVHRVSWSFVDDLPWGRCALNESVGALSSKRSAPWAGPAPARR